MTLSLRTRLAAAAGAAIVAAVAALGVAVVAYVDAQLRDSLDGDLRRRAVEVARLSATTPALLTAPGALEGRLGGSALYVQVVDRRGRLVARSSGLGGRVLPDGPATRAALRERRTAYADEELGAEPIRVFAAPLGELGAGPAAGGAVVVAGTTSGLEETVADARLAALVIGGASALLAVALAIALTGRALLPLRRLSGGAREIERTGDARRRLELPATRDELHELAATLNAMLASLERARAAEQRFVADASHELRNPLTALRGNAAYLARHGADEEALGDLQAGAERLSALLDDLLALAREDATGPPSSEPVDLVALAHEVLEDDPGPSSVAAGDDEVLVAGDRPSLRRAVANLVANARAHGPAGGRVTVTVDGGPATARLTVLDEGPGLPAEHAAHAFERFWRGPSADAPGSGLGLSIVRAIAERHGGRASADGAAFTIELDRLRDLSEPVRTTGSSTHSDPSGER